MPVDAREAALEAVKDGISRPCPTEHVIHKRDEDNDSTTFWITCGETQLGSINVPHSSQDASYEIRWFQRTTMYDHEHGLEPVAALDALASSPEVREALVAAVTNSALRTVVEFREDVHSEPDRTIEVVSIAATVDAVLAALTGTSGTEAE